MIISGIMTNPKCFNELSGSINLIVSGGNGGLHFAWNTGDTIVPLFNLSAGQYQVTVTDKNNCIDSAKYSLSQPDSLWVKMQKTDAHNGKADGKAFVTAFGGAPPYQYIWDANTGNQTTDTAFGLLPGKYFVTVTDINGCAVLDSAIIDVIIGIKKNTIDNQISIFPVPANNEIELRIHQLDEDADLSIQNETGITVYTDKIPLGSLQKTIDISTWPAGLYFIRLKSGNNRYSQKFMVIH
jgi:type IX secretion system substrate protein/SprB-like repeat protein